MDKIRVGNLQEYFKDNHDFMMEYRLKKEQEELRKEKEELKKWEGIDWLIEHGVPLQFINKLIKQGKLVVATIEEAKRQYTRLINLCDIWDGFETSLFDDGTDKLKELLKTLKELEDEGIIKSDDEIEIAIRNVISNNKDLYSEEDLMRLIESTFKRTFKFEWVSSYTRKTGKIVDAYVRVQFKDKKDERRT